MQTADAALRAQVPDFATARAEYEAVLAMPPTRYGVLARIRLASVDRLEGRPWDALARLEAFARDAADGALQRWLDAYAQFLLDSEFTETYVLLGLPDLAVVHATGAAKAAASDRDRLGACLQDLRVRLVARDWDGVDQVSTRVLAEPQFAAAGDAVLAPVRLYRLMARSRRLRAPGELREVAAALRALFEDLVDPSNRRSALRQAAEAWAAAGDLQAAAECNAMLALDDASDAREAVEILGQRARLAMATGAAGERLTSLRRQLDLQMRAWLQDLRTAPLRESGSGTFNIASSRDAVATLARLDTELLPGDEGLEAAFSVMESAFRLGSTTRRLGADVEVGLADLRRHVPRDGGLLMLAAGPWSATFLVADRDGLEAVSVPLDPAFWQGVDTFVAAASRAPAAAVDATAAIAALRRFGEGIGERLLPATLRTRMERWQRLVFVGDEENGRLLHVLSWADTWLAQRFAVSCLPSITLGNALAARGDRQGEPPRIACRLLADPPIDAAMRGRYGVAPIGLDDAQRRALLGALGDGDAEARFGGDATVAGLGDAASAARLLCVFTHGIEEFTRERSAGILLAGEGGVTMALFADAIERLLVPPVVVLAACSAAAGPRRLGDDGARHLGGAFFVAGARVVVLAGNRLSLGATRDLVAEFLAAWRAGEPVAVALRVARSHVAASAGRAHPYFWAGMQVLGVDDGR